MLTYDVIIVGQGVAGSILCHALEKKKQKVLVVDRGHDNSASRAAAGLINPITGRYFTKSWMIDDLLPYAISTYLELEQLLACKLWYPTTIYRALHTITQVNDWQARLLDQDYQQYGDESSDTGPYQSIVTKPLSTALIKGGGRVDLSRLIAEHRSYLEAKQCLLEESFAYEHLVLEDKIIYKNRYEARQIVFAQGVGVCANPLFQDIGLNPAKGESLIYEVKETTLPDAIIKHLEYIVPIGNNQAWTGGGFEKNTMNALPTMGYRETTMDKLKTIIQEEISLKNHHAGIRPTIKDRRPIIGRHTHHPHVFLFNGMGTKGASLAPYWADHLVEHMIDDNSIDPEVKYTRFRK